MSSWSTKRRSEADVIRRAKYDSPAHRRTRAALALEVAAGRASCWRCNKPIPPGTPWHLGHDDENPTVVRGPEHATCNLTAAARKAAAITNARHAPTPFVRPLR